VAALVDRIGRHSGLGDAVGRRTPCVTRLAAAMEQQHRAAGFTRPAIGLRAEHVADKAIAVRSRKYDSARIGMRIGV